MKIEHTLDREDLRKTWEIQLWTANRQTDRQTDRQRQTETERERERERATKRQRQTGRVFGFIYANARQKRFAGHQQLGKTYANRQGTNRHLLSIVYPPMQTDRETDRQNFTNRGGLLAALWG